MLALVILVVVLMITANALYVAAEFSAVNSRRTRVADQAANGVGAAKALLPVLENRVLLDRYIAASQVGITLSSLVVGFYGQAQLTPVVAPLLARVGLSEAATRSVTVIGLLLFLTFLQVVFGELLPKSLALRYPERVGLLLVRPMRWSLVVLRPLIAVLNGSAHLLLKRLGRVGREESHVHHPDELEVIFKESADGGLIDAGEREMLSRVFRLRRRVVRQIVVPRNRMIAIPVSTPAGAKIRDLIETGHTRFPVYGDGIDDIRGAVSLRELYTLSRRDPEATLESIVRPVPVMPELLSITEAWARMRSEQATMAAVFDEYGGVVGIITLEDVIEELFGELQDEFDREADLFSQDPEGQLELRGDMLVSDVNDRFLLALPEEPADTIGGLMMAMLGRPAREGDEVTGHGVRLVALETRGQAVSRVRLTAVDDEGEEYGTSDGGGGSDDGAADSAGPADDSGESAGSVDDDGSGGTDDGSSGAGDGSTGADGGSGGSDDSGDSFERRKGDA